MNAIMYLLLRIIAVTLATTVFAYVPESTLATDLLAVKSLARLVESVENGELKRQLSSRGVNQSCTLSQLAVRRE
jgi:hypothetical protein